MDIYNFFISYKTLIRTNSGLPICLFLRCVYSPPVQTFFFCLFNPLVHQGDHLMGPFDLWPSGKVQEKQHLDQNPFINLCIFCYYYYYFAISISHYSIINIF